MIFAYVVRKSSIQIRKCLSNEIEDDSVWVNSSCVILTIIVSFVNKNAVHYLFFFFTFSSLNVGDLDGTENYSKGVQRVLRWLTQVAVLVELNDAVDARHPPGVGRGAYFVVTNSNEKRKGFLGGVVHLPARLGDLGPSSSSLSSCSCLTRSCGDIPTRIVRIYIRALHMYETVSLYSYPTTYLFQQ